ncbi:MAG: hypothetical protein SFV17_22080 [Candidatus Obscuribacter sp.]|nr:hypothetical protein [Candidatus Melainabacteria bacterium]MDX1989392.1 hypothetical protein [Candidatus Obscuribacter sp.]
MQTIQQSISDSMRVLEKWTEAQNSTPPAVSTEEMLATMKELLASDLAARGFMAALSTSQIDLSGDFLKALKQAVQEHPAVSHDLIVKNIIMSATASIQHKNSGKSEQALASQAVSERNCRLAQLLSNDGLDATLKAASQAIDSFETTRADTAAATSAAGASSEAGQTDDYWHSFFRRWGYTRELLQEVQSRYSSSFSR